jgi:hypothetical protein
MHIDEKRQGRDKHGIPTRKMEETGIQHGKQEHAKKRTRTTKGTLIVIRTQEQSREL